MKQYFRTKTNFFQLRKIFTREYTTNTLQVFTENLHSLLASFLQTHKPKREKIGGWRIISIIKNRRGVVAPFYTLSFSFFFLFLLQTANTTFLHTYLYFIYLFACRSLCRQIRRILLSFLCLCFDSSFQCFVWLYIRFRSVPCLFLFPPKPTHPTPFSRCRIGGYPIP